MAEYNDTAHWDDRDGMWSAYQAHCRTERWFGRCPMTWSEWVFLADEAENADYEDLRKEAQGRDE